VIRLLPEGEGGLLVQLGDGVDADVNARVHALARAVARSLGPLVVEVVPSYASLLVVFDPLRLPRERLEARVAALAGRVERVRAGPPRRVLELPVCYGGDLGPDLDDVARATGLAPADVVARHAAPVYRVFLLGFTPGFPYLGGMDPALACPRLPTPRLRVPAGSVAVAGPQTGVYPVESPGGWRILGRTPLRLFDPAPAAARPFLVAPGDGLRFVPVDRARYDALRPGPAGDGARPERAPRSPGTAGPGAPRGGRAPGLAVLRAGLLSTVQDAGRTGHRASGLPVAGAMDRHALAAANVLAGNPPGAAALELTLAGGAFRFEAAALAALAGADLSATLDGAPLPAWGAFRARAGSVVAFGAPRAGVRAYLAVRGGIAVPAVLGSRATYTRAGVGGLAGRPLAAGDLLPLARPRGPAPAPVALAPTDVPPCGGGGAVRVLLGPQADRFGEAGLAAFLATAWRASPRNDRMGYRLDGPPLPLPTGADILTDPVVPGAVQIANDGRPIVMMVDAQTTGGYAKIATVIGPDLRLVAQAGAGDVLRFVACSQAEAVEALRAERAWIAGLARAGRWPSRRVTTP
jgi:KipI family sensor histidine kinase inhibitor